MDRLTLAKAAAEAASGVLVNQTHLDWQGQVSRGRLAGTADSTLASTSARRTVAVSRGDAPSHGHLCDQQGHREKPHGRALGFLSGKPIYFDLVCVVPTEAKRSRGGHVTGQSQSEYPILRVTVIGSEVSLWLRSDQGQAVRGSFRHPRCLGQQLAHSRCAINGI